MSPAGVATPMLSYADSDEGVGRGLQQALLPTEGKIARERERESEREREREREREGYVAILAQVLHPLFGGLCCPLSSGRGAGGLAWAVTPGEPFRFPSAVLESHVRSRVLKWPFRPFRAAGPLTAAPFGGGPPVGGKTILFDCGTHGQLPGATPTGDGEQRQTVSLMQRGGGDLHSRL